MSYKFAGVLGQDN